MEDQMETAIIKKENLRELGHIEGIKCFACSPQNPIGLKMDFFADETCVYSWLKIADHFCSWDTIVHGGIVVVVLDEIMSWAATYFLKKFTITKSCNVDFMKTVYTNMEIRAEGRVKECLSEKKVIIEGSIYNNSKNELCARAAGEYILFDSFKLNKNQNG